MPVSNFLFLIPFMNIDDNSGNLGLSWGGGEIYFFFTLPKYMFSQVHIHSHSRIKQHQQHVLREVGFVFIFTELTFRFY